MIIWLQPARVRSCHGGKSPRRTDGQFGFVVGFWALLLLLLCWLLPSKCFSLRVLCFHDWRSAQHISLSLSLVVVVVVVATSGKKQTNKYTHPRAHTHTQERERERERERISCGGCVLLGALVVVVVAVVVVVRAWEGFGRGGRSCLAGPVPGNGCFAGQSQTF